MSLPFTTDDFLAVFAAYNRAIWPLQIPAYGLGLVAVAAVLMPDRTRLRLGLAAMAILWAFIAVGYHLMFFASINPIAPVFAALFVLQGALFLVSALFPGDLRPTDLRLTDLRRGDLRLRLGPQFPAVAGLTMIVYAVAIYPALGIWAGHGGMAGPMFGVAPCPTTIFTLGLLAIVRGRWVVWLSIIPVLWSFIGLAAAVQLGIPEDLGMPLAGVILVAILVGRSYRRAAQRARTARPVP